MAIDRTITEPSTLVAWRRDVQQSRLALPTLINSELDVLDITGTEPPLRTADAQQQVTVGPTPQLIRPRPTTNSTERSPSWTDVN